MPDVTITCPSCGKTITVSEFVDLTKLVCRTCGGCFRQPEGSEAPDVDDDSRDEESVREPVVTFTPPAPASVIAKVTPQPRKRFRWTYQMKCWSVFVCVGLFSLVLRYGRVLGSDSLEALIEYGPMVVLTLWLYVTFRAFRDSVMAGTLSLLVPFYALYYTFWSLEDYMFRAVFAGILVGTGADSLVFMFNNAATVIPSINSFLNSGM